MPEVKICGEKRGRKEKERERSRTFFPFPFLPPSCEELSDKAFKPWDGRAERGGSKVAGEVKRKD